MKPKSFIIRTLLWLFLVPIKRQRLRQMHRMMAGMLRRSYPLSGILEALSRGFPCCQKTLARLSLKAREGTSLSEAMDSEWLPTPLIMDAMIRTGEEHGVLPRAVTLACELDDPIQLRKQKTRTLAFLFYIVVSAIGGIVVLTWLFIFVVPVFKDMFAVAGVGLPEVTRLTIKIAEGIKSYLWLILPLALILISLLMGASLWIYRWEGALRVSERIPLVGSVFAYSRWWKVLYGGGVLMEAGLSPDKALSAMGRGLAMPSLISAGERIAMRLSRGTDTLKAIKEEKNLPKRLGWVLAMGADQGNPARTMINMGEIYRDMHQANMSRMISMAFLLTTLLTVGVMGTVVFSMYLPIFTMAGFFI